MAKIEPAAKLGKLTAVDPKEVQAGPIWHSELRPFLAGWARKLYGRVGHHLCPTLEQWELGFLHDAQPQSEMFVWECIARAYEAYLSDHPNCDTCAVFSDLTLISLHAAFEGKSGATEELRELYCCIWKRMTDDGDAVREEVRQSLGEDVADD